MNTQDNFFERHFKWPGRKFFICYATITGALTILAALSTVFNQGAEHSLFARLSMAAVLAVLVVIHGALLYVMIALYSRLFVNARTSWRQLRAWSPGALASMRSNCRSGYLAIGQAIGWCARLPRRLRLPTKEELAFSAFAASIVAIVALIGWLFWPLAERLTQSIPDWLPGSARTGSYQDLISVLFVDILISCLPISFTLAIWTSVVRVALKRFKRS